MVARNGADGEPTPLVVYIDYVCPYCYLAESVLTRLRSESAVEVEYRPFELRPEPAPRLDPGDPELRRAWDEGIRPLAERLGVEIELPPVQPRSRKAHEAAAFARDQGRLPAMHERLFRAFFLDGRDIGRIDVLLDIAEAAGLERSALKVALDIDQYTEQVVAVQEEALEAGITGVPTFTMDDDRLVGLQPYETLRDWVQGRRR